MPEAASPLTIELLTWIAARPRTYSEAIEVWVSNCPRHPVWDDALIAGLVRIDGRASTVTLTELGRALLDGPR